MELEDAFDGDWDSFDFVRGFLGEDAKGEVWRCRQPPNPIVDVSEEDPENDVWFAEEEVHRATRNAGAFSSGVEPVLNGWPSYGQSHRIPYKALIAKVATGVSFSAWCRMARMRKHGQFIRELDASVWGVHGL